MKTRILHAVEALILPVAIVVIWWVASKNSTSVYWPPLDQILDTFAQTWFFDRFTSDLLPSVSRFAAGFAIAVVAGVVAGLLLGLSARARRDVGPVTEFLRATPVVALVPVALILIGPGASMEIAVIAFGSVWPILVATTDGVRGVDPLLLETARVYGMPWHRRVREVVLPAALPAIFPGIRIAIAVGITVMLVANMYAASSGLGFFVVDSQNRFDVTGTWAGLLIIGLVGVVANLVFVIVQRRALAWHRGWRGSAREQT